MFTRRHQIKPSTRDFPVQAKPTLRTVGTQYCINDVAENVTSTEEEEDWQSEEEPDDPTDLEWEPDTEDIESISDEYFEDRENEINEVLTAKEPNKERQFLVGETCLLELLNKCKECGQNACVKLKSFVGTMIVVDVQCCLGHEYTWRSQLCSNAMPWGNLLLSAAILYSGGSPARILTMFNHLKVPVFTTKTYSNLQYSYLVPSVLRTWDLHQAEYLTEVQGQSLCLGGDGRCDSPGHTAKFGSYSLMNLKENKIIHIELVQVCSSILLTKGVERIARSQR